MTKQELQRIDVAVEFEDGEKTIPVEIHYGDDQDGVGIPIENDDLQEFGPYIRFIRPLIKETPLSCVFSDQATGYSCDMDDTELAEYQDHHIFQLGFEDDGDYIEDNGCLVFAPSF